MPIRTPIYLDQDLLQNIADYLGIGYPVETKVRELGTRGRTGSGGMGLPGTGINAKGERSSTDEVETTYEAPVRPVKVLNDVLDSAIASGDVKQFVGGQDTPVVRRDLVEVEGTVSLSALSEAGEMLEKFLPAIAQMPGVVGPDGPPPEFIAAFFSDESAPRPLLFDLNSPDVIGVRICVQLERGWFHRNASADDLSGELTVFGSLDQLVPQGGTLSLERFLMPGANRATRRIVGPEALSDLLAKLGKPGQALTLEGPAWILRPIAVF